MRGSWKRRGVAASFVAFLLAGSGCGPKEATDLPDRASRARRRLREMAVQEKLPAPEAAEFEESTWPAVEPAAQPEEEVVAPVEEEGEAEPPIAEEAEEDEAAEPERPAEEKELAPPAGDDWNWE